MTVDHAEAAFHHTVDYWRQWLARCKYAGRWREIVHRSLLTLKLLTFAPTGAIIAAPTTSLPESIGAVRNWDYRYSWIRDSAFTIYSFLRYGYREEAAHYVEFLETACRAPAEGAGPLRVMYGIDGGSHLDEIALDHLEGYRGSRPVRIGNAAHDQLQLDIYGELIDCLYLHNKWGTPLAHETWQRVHSYVDWVVDNWEREDRGIWEVRGDPRHFVSSKLMCWVAIDRAIRLARRRSFPADIGRWSRVRDTIYQQIMERGFDGDRGTFVMSYGDDALDASLLMMPLTLFVAPTDPRWLGTLEAIMQPPRRGGLLSNHLVFRYDVDRDLDGFEAEEGTFNMCTFWLIESLTRAGRYRPEMLERARLTFERMLGFANHLGLYGEETGSRGEALGNFPQAFTHLSLLSAAYNLERALGAGA
jgi:GH15 family glucan-1,4-alpha-glucosidase